MAIHQSWSDSVKRTTERLRESGMSQSEARKVAEQASTDTHRKLDKKK